MALILIQVFTIVDNIVTQPRVGVVFQGSGSENE